jgi:hypothetical protein
VTADLQKLSAGRADYYVREVARDHEEYLSGQGESPGKFLGAGSKALGESGVCSEQEFRRLFAWRHPDTGQQLGRAPRSDAMPAWDLVLRPVKDVAIVYALGDQPTSRAARDAHQAGVKAAVSYLDGQVGTRTGRDGAKHVAGSGLVAVGFTHRVSRSGDPCPTPTWSSSTAPKAPTANGGPLTAGTCSATARPPTPSTGPATSTS